MTWDWATPQVIASMVAGLVAAAGAGLTVFFTFRTAKGIREHAERTAKETREQTDRLAKQR